VPVTLQSFERAVADQDRRRMAGVRVGEDRLANRRSEVERRVLLSRGACIDLAVQQSHDAGGEIGPGIPVNCAAARLDGGHQERRRDTFAGYIADRHCDRGSLELEIVVIVSGDNLRGMQTPIMQMERVASEAEGNN